MKKLKRLVVCSMFLCVLALPFHAYADVITDEDLIASDSNAEEIEEDEIYSEEIDTESIISYLENIDRSVTDIQAAVVPDEVSDQGYYTVTYSSDLEGVTFSLDSDFNLNENIIIYEGTFNGNSYRLVFPRDYEKYLIVSDEGYLYNVSGSSVTGRLFDGTADFNEYEYSTFTLQYVLGNVASNIYSYGYPSYVTTYYLSTSGSYDRITSTNTYGLFHVDNVVRTSSDDPNYININYLLILMMIGGMMLLCFTKKSQR